MKKLLIIIAAMLLNIGTSFAAGEAGYTGIIAVVNGSETSYALHAVPSVDIINKDGIRYANISVNGQSQPVASIALEENQELSIVYGTYSAAGTDGTVSQKVSTYTKNGKKYITGGKLIVIGKDGKLYDADGNKIQ